MAAPKPTCKRIFLFTHARTTSNLLIKMLAKHPQIEISHYPFVNAFDQGPERLKLRNHGMNGNPDFSREATRDETYQNAFDRLQRFIALVEEQVPFIKEHVYFFIDPKVVARNTPPEVHRQVLSRPRIVDHHHLGPHHGFPESGPGSSTSHTNPTVLPDAFLKTMSPVILFRHPARMIPSFYRAALNGRIGIDVNDEDFPVEASLRWVRLVFDWFADKVPGGRRYVSKSADEAEDILMIWPLVIEGDDLINEARVMPGLCEKLGLDPQYLQTSWEKVPLSQREARGLTVSSFLATIQNSTGIIKTGRRDYELDLAEEKKSLIQEFGSEIGHVVARYVEDAMPDYHYLRQFRI